MIVVVAGTGRKAGKTSVTAGLIAALPDFNWVAIKISRHQHGLGWGVTEEHAPSATDTGRYLAAGARRAFWIRAADTEMALASAEVQRIAAANARVIIESNSIIPHLSNAFVIVVMDGSVQPKPSAADASVAPTPSSCQARAMPRLSPRFPASW